ncbi:hypothetical protein CPB84DRAFT_1746559 [Gymnopilus junonius]|uniref:Uncharacterized protein n=1 Tax=Gymnopilus junonius TaxID=109634 RepID=A0A9P5NPY9_GYMJU|nr:hypothetical protein CPB84DRAFT_1746559 [Gymnopilus junonius]
MDGNGGWPMKTVMDAEIVPWVLDDDTDEHGYRILRAVVWKRHLEWFPEQLGDNIRTAHDRVKYKKHTITPRIALELPDWPSQYVSEGVTSPIQEQYEVFIRKNKLITGYLEDLMREPYHDMAFNFPYFCFDDGYPFSPIEPPEAAKHGYRGKQPQSRFTLQGYKKNNSGNYQIQDLSIVASRTRPGGYLRKMAEDKKEQQRMGMNESQNVSEIGGTGAPKTKNSHIKKSISKTCRRSDKNPPFCAAEGRTSSDDIHPSRAGSTALGMILYPPQAWALGRSPGDLSSWMNSGKLYKDVPDFVSDELLHRLSLSEKLERLLPPPTLTISELLDFDIPPIQDTAIFRSVKSCFSNIEPQYTNVFLVKRLREEAGQAMLDGKVSIVDWKNKDVYLPFEVLSFWDYLHDAAIFSFLEATDERQADYSSGGTVIEAMKAEEGAERGKSRNRIRRPPMGRKFFSSDTKSTQIWVKSVTFVSIHGGQKSGISVSDLSQSNQGSCAK